MTLFYLSANALLDANDTLLNGSRAVAAIAGAVSSGSTTITIPSGSASGTFLCESDGGETIAETQKNNKGQACHHRSDLMVSTMLVTSRPARLLVLVTATVTNQGGGDAGPSTTKFYLSLDFRSTRTMSCLPEAGKFLRSWRAHRNRLTQVTLPPGIAPGTYYVFGKADAGAWWARALRRTMRRRGALG